MNYRLTSERMHSEGGLELTSEDGSPMCSEFRRVPVPCAPRVVSPAVLRTLPHCPLPRRRTYRGRKTYTAVRPDGLKVTITAEAHAEASQAEADETALALARCRAEQQAAAGLIPLQAENGAPLASESQQSLTSEPIAA